MANYNKIMSKFLEINEARDYINDPNFTLDELKEIYNNEKINSMSDKHLRELLRSLFDLYMVKDIDKNFELFKHIIIENNMTHMIDSNLFWDYIIFMNKKRTNQEYIRLDIIQFFVENCNDKNELLYTKHSYNYNITKYFPLVFIMNTSPDRIDIIDYLYKLFREDFSNNQIDN